MATPQLIIEETNLSHAWCRTLDFISKNKGKEVTPLLLTLTDFNESKDIRTKLDNHLMSNGKASIQTVSETIFPQSLYEFYNKDRHTLYKEYKGILPRIHKIDSKNNRGTYFERLIHFDGKVNQLEIIISSYNRKHSIRRSALQASIFDPNKDHIRAAYQGFPCLQHVTFSVNKEGLTLNSFYAIQYLYQKAYGNWLGLINLGKFMANELNVKLERFNCYAGVEQLEINKDSVASLVGLVK